MAENRKSKYLKYFCGHGKYKYRCKECKGAQICSHDRQKYQCKECKGSQLCLHDRQKSFCKECGGSQICSHGRQKQTCKECKGSQICSHDRQKQTCKECKGSQTCVHDRLKQYCKKCGGSQICVHNREKKTCKECGGSQICPHDKRKQTCKKCSDPIKVSIKQWIISRRQYDKMRNIYDADRFIDKCFLEGLVEDYKQCYYGDCQDAVGLGPVNLQYTEYQDDLATIERLDNSIGHIKSNCVLCCLKCNVSKKSNNLIYLS